jgi:hypothetical protein
MLCVLHLSGKYLDWHKAYPKRNLVAEDFEFDLDPIVAEAAQLVLPGQAQVVSHFLKDR